jgi:lipopolysaccharide transport system permease protein
MLSSSTIIIEPGSGFHNYWRDLWRYRELFYMMAWRDVLLRYKRMTIGFAWALLKPFLTMLIFTLVFGKLAKLPSDGVPYPILVFSALLPWQFFATAFSDAGGSLINKESIITKIYFPRLVIPVSAVMVSFVDFLSASTILCGMMTWYGVIPDWRILFLPLFILILFAVSLGAGLWISALSAKYKDFRYVIPFIVQIGLYVSPVGFDSSLVPETWRTLYAINPMVGIIQGFRWSILGKTTAGFEVSVIIAAGMALLLMFSGVAYFRRMELSLAEIL